MPAYTRERYPLLPDEYGKVMAEPARPKRPSFLCFFLALHAALGIFFTIFGMVFFVPTGPAGFM